MINNTMNMNMNNINTPMNNNNINTQSNNNYMNKQMNNSVNNQMTNNVNSQMINNMNNPMINNNMTGQDDFCDYLCKTWNYYQFYRNMNNINNQNSQYSQNKMKVVETFSFEKNNQNLLKMGTMCTDCTLSKEKYHILVEGEPTEKAIVEEALRLGINKDNLYIENKRVKDIPFDSGRKMMTTIHKTHNGYLVITKGAPDVLLKRCNKFYDGSYENKLSFDKIKYIENAF